MAYSFMEVEEEKQEEMKKIRDSIIKVEPTFDLKAHTANSTSKVMRDDVEKLD